MGFASRMGQLWKGFLSLFVGNLEKRNPEAVFEAAIAERIEKHRELKKAVASIVYLRNKTQTELDEKKAELVEVEAQIPVAVEEGEDEVALLLLEKQEKLTASIADLQLQLEKISGQADSAKESLVAFQADIQRLKREKVELLAQKQQAEARIKIQETLDGLSLDADVKALENVRENIGQLSAEADVGSELGESNLDAKLEKIRQKTGNATARRKLDELKKQAAAKKAAASPDKTM